MCLAPEPAYHVAACRLNLVTLARCLNNFLHCRQPVAVLLHEIGHALITEMGLPVLRREEDPADAHASVAMLWMKNEFSDRVLAEAAKGWFYGDRRDRTASARGLLRRT